MTLRSRRAAIAAAITLLAAILFARGRVSTTAARLVHSAAIWRDGEAYVFIEVRTAFWSGSRGQHWAYSILERLPLFWVPGSQAAATRSYFAFGPARWTR